MDGTLAIPAYRGRVHHLRGVRDELPAGLVREFVARAHSRMRKDPHSAAQCARLGALAARTLGDDEGLVDSLRALGQAYVLHGRFRQALRAFDRAIEIGGDETLDLLRLQPLIHLERYGEAQATGDRLLERLRDPKGRIRTRMALADLAFRLDRPRDALLHYARVDAILPPDASPRFRAVLACNRANALEARNRFRAAMRHFDRARDLLGGEGCDHTLAQVDYNAAYAEALRGSYEAALRDYARTREVFRRLGDERHLALIDLERAEIHVQLNLPEEARPLALRAERSFAALGMRKESAQAAQMAGQAAILLGDRIGAEASLQYAQQVFAELGLQDRCVSCLVQLAQLATEERCLEDAHWFLEETEVRLSHAGNPLTKASVELARAQLDLAHGNPTAALHRADAVCAECRRVHAPWIRIEAHRLVGRAHAARDDVDEAILAYRHAIDELERYRGGVPADEYMAAFLAGRAGLYAEIVKLLVRAGHTEAAFEFTERGKARALVDLLAGRARPGGRALAGSLTARRIEHLRETLNASYQRLFRAETRSAAALGRAAALEEELTRLLREARLAASPRAADTPDMASLQRDLDHGTVLVEYLVTEEEILLFVVTRDRAVVVRQAVPRSELSRLVERFRFHLLKTDRESAAALAATQANLAGLARVLIAPIAGQLDARRLVIVPDGVLRSLPFHALPWREGLIADRFEVVYAPSAAVYSHCRDESHPDGPACVFGLPDDAAPRMETEARRVASVLGTDRVYVNEEATFERLREQAASARLLHIATHGMFRRDRPWLSAIRLADRWLNLYDLYALDLRAELVVLSACESGVAAVTDGGEILGLARGLLCAGARAFLTSQWRVDDEATLEFMEGFYGHIRGGRDPAAALRETMAAVRANRPHPYYWAPFFLTGRPASHESHA